MYIVGTKGRLFGRPTYIPCIMVDIETRISIVVPWLEQKTNDGPV